MKALVFGAFAAGQAEGVARRLETLLDVETLAMERAPFHELPNVIMTPHCSPWTEGSVARRGAGVARNLDRFVRGEPLDNILART